MPLVQRYLEWDHETYRSCVEASPGMVLGYVAPAGQTKIDERALSHSTLWRWIGYLGALTASLTLGLELWIQHHPSSDLHRFPGSVAPRKARSLPRLESLRTARRLLHLRNSWDSTFGFTFLPRFATRSGFS